MYNGQGGQGLGQNKFNKLLSRFNQPPPNPYQGNQKPMQMSGYMMPQQGYQPQYSYNRYNDMYDNEAISDDSSDGMHDDPNENEADPEVDLGSYVSNRGMMSLVSDNNLLGGMGGMPAMGNVDELLPEIPDIPAMARIADVNMEAEEEELTRHVGFVIKLNSRLVELNATVRALYPSLAEDLVDSVLSEFVEKEYVRLVESKVALEAKCNEYEVEIASLGAVKNLKNDLSSEVDRLRTLTAQYASNNNAEERDYREMLSSASRAYVNEIQKQLDIYREKVMILSQQNSNCMTAIKNSVHHQVQTQESIQNAYGELKPLQEHLQFLEDNQAEANADVDKLRVELSEKMERLEFKNKALQNELDILKHQSKNARSEKIANKAQIEEHIEFKYKEEIRGLQENLSKMMVERIEFEDQNAQRQKDEQERADKYRAKYESVKQHVKTLEMQKVEYTRVNMQLRQQNNEFRQMITTLQNQLKMISEQQQQQQQAQAYHHQQQQQQQPHHQQQQRLMQLEQQQKLMRQQNMLRARNASKHQHSLSQSNVNRKPHAHHKQANSYGPNQMQQQIDPNQNRKLWGKQTKELSTKGTKKRVLIEWHFVTSDTQPHTVVLQHTQDTKPKTRRMLWVDGVEKYNNKSSASSFRIEIDKDVVVVSIDQLDQYQYRLTINNATYQDAFKLWENRQKR
eukprot:252264_1